MIYLGMRGSAGTATPTSPPPPPPPPPPQLTIVQSCQSGLVSGTPTITAGGAGWPQPVTAGNSIVALLSSTSVGSTYGITSTTDSAGDTYTQDIDICNSLSGARQYEIGVARARCLAGGTPTVTVLLNTAPTIGAVLALFEVQRSTDLSVNAANISAVDNTTPGSNGITTTAAPNLAIGVIASIGAVTYTEPSGYTSVQSVQGSGVMSADFSSILYASAGPENPQWTQSPTTGWSCLLVAYT
jgi:hypothetical protein